MFLLFDILLSYSGYNTIIIHLHPVLPNIAIFSCIFLIVLMTIKAIGLVTDGQWKKFSTLLLTIIFIVVITNISVKILSINSEKRAYEMVKSFFTGKNNNFIIKVEDDLENDYLLFKQTFEPSTLKLLNSIPMAGRYDFLVIIPQTRKTFIITLLVKKNGAKIWIHKD